MSTLPEVRGAARVGERLGRLHPLRSPELVALAYRLRYPLGIYAASRALYLVIALVDLLVRHGTLAKEVTNWDGKWYLLTVLYGYPQTIWHTQTTLGFLPLYPMQMWVLGQPFRAVGLHAQTSYILSGVIISLVAGAIATVLISRLAERWWGEAAARRAILFFCLFPGTIVFSMIYSEGLLLALLAGAILAIERRRWLTAGVLAGLATGVAPVATAIIPAFAVVALLEIRRRGWHDREARRALLAPVLAPAGLIGFGAFLWVWTGSPFASYTTQHSEWGWQESTTPTAIPRQANVLVHEIARFTFHNPGINLNFISGIAGTVFLLYAISRLWHWRSSVSLAALLWTLGVAVLTLTSANTPPNPRMLICAFPAVLVIGAEAEGRGQKRLLWFTVVVTLAMSMGSFVGTGLRP
jgi:Gpi18-like mannosyltransferase